MASPELINVRKSGRRTRVMKISGQLGMCSLSTPPRMLKPKPKFYLNNVIRIIGSLTSIGVLLYPDSLGLDDTIVNGIAKR